jgi:hypothetical protein
MRPMLRISPLKKTNFRTLRPIRIFPYNRYNCLFDNTIGHFITQNKGRHLLPAPMYFPFKVANPSVRHKNNNNNEPARLGPIKIRTAKDIIYDKIIGRCFSPPPCLTSCYCQLLGKRIDSG